MLIGYSRVSTADQILDLQTDALNQAGCSKIFTDVCSGAKAERKGLDAALIYAREGDTLCCWKLDRLGRSLKHLIDLANHLNERNIGLKSLQEGIDTTTAAGKLFFHVFGALAEFERDLIRERTLAGLSAARARGRKGGRKRQFSDKRIEAIKLLADSSTDSISDICNSMQISPATYYRRLKQMEKAIAK